MTTTRSPTWSARLVVALTVGFWGLLLLCGPIPAFAAAGNFAFGVSVTLNKLVQPGSGLCTSSTGVGMFGATVTVVCSTSAVVVGLETVERGMPWKPTHGGAHRFLTRSSSGAITGTVHSHTGVGTSTNFRVISAADQEYIEMTVEW